MAEKTNRLGRAPAGECRKCATWCDKVIDPRGCEELGCPYLYSYPDRASGREFMGCMYKVFAGEVDVELFTEAVDSREGYGGLKMTGQPLPHCPFTVEAAFEGSGEEFSCRNARFFDCTDEGRLGIRVFDVRATITE
ncbi:MAG: hypothetical protein ACR2NA_11530 [Solirubrobacterales bacterium]